MGDTAPWEDYQSQSGPWSDYAGQSSPPASFQPVDLSQPKNSFIPQTPTYQPGGFWQNALAGVKKFYSDAGLAGAQIYAQLADKNILPILQQQAAQKRQADSPLMGTWGGKLGVMAGAAPAALVPGANTYVGAAAVGGALGALQPTTEDESRLTNIGIGAGIGVAGKAAGDFVGRWAPKRAEEPITGWRQATGNLAAAEAVGSDAKSLTQTAIGETSKRFEQVFNAARSPDVSVPVSDATVNALETAGKGLNESSRGALFSNSDVKDLIAHLGQNPTAEQLGTITSNLGKEAAAQMSSKSGDRALGQALFAVKEHVDDLIGSSIQDSSLKAAYDAARPQYRTFLTLTRRPTLLNSSTGDVNLRNLGNYLQRYDTGFREGTNISPLYQAARWGQATRLGSAPPSLLQPIKALSWYGVNNPVTGAATGLTSRLLAPAAPTIRAGLPGLNIASEPVLLPYLTE